MLLIILGIIIYVGIGFLVNYLWQLNNLCNSLCECDYIDVDNDTGEIVVEDTRADDFARIFFSILWPLLPCYFIGKLKDVLEEEED